MKLKSSVSLRDARLIVFDDGQPLHRAYAVVLESDETGLTVQFSDRASTTRIQFTDTRWTNYLTVID